MSRALFVLFTAIALATPAATQPAPAPASNVPFPPGFEAAQTAFLALPLEERRAIQLALVWTGDFQGIASGEFGRLTFQGLQTFQRRLRQGRADAVLEPAQRRALQADADRNRTAARFEIVADQRTGVRMGVPFALVETPPAGQALPNGTRWAARDNAVNLVTTLYADTETDLAALHQRLSRSEGQRRVTFQVLRPDFFVVSGQSSADRRFYTRVARRADGRLVGYSLGWNVSTNPNFDRVNIAISNAFDPAPGAQAPVASAPAIAARPAAPPATAPTPPPAVQVAAIRVGSAGKAVVPESAANGCRTMTVGGREATRAPGAAAVSGLAILDVRGAPAGLPLAPMPTAGKGLVVITRTMAGIEVGGLPPGSEPVFAGGPQGAALLDRSGRLVAVATGQGRLRTVSVGGIGLAIPQTIVEAGALAAATSVTVASEPAPFMPMAEVVTRAAAAVEPFGCTR